MQRYFFQISILLIISTLALPIAADTNAAAKNNLAEAEFLLWNNPDSTMTILEAISFENLSANEKPLYRLFYEHAYLRMNKEMSPSWNFNEFLTYFSAKSMKRYLAEAYYLQAASCELNSDYYKSIEALKNAEALLEDTNAPEELLGILYYRMAAAFETDLLPEIAIEYYNKALAHLLKTDQHLFLACTYRDLARTATQEDVQTEYYSLALNHARLVSDSTFSYEIQLLMGNGDLSLARTMAISQNQPRYANGIVEYFIQENQPDSALYYLAIFALDTISNSWSKERYNYLSSKILYLQNKPQQAFSVLSQLYDNISSRLTEEGTARTYAISRQFDVMREKERNLQLQISRQHAYIVIAALAIGLLIGGIILMLLLWRNRENKLKIEGLNQELTRKRENLRNFLQQKVRMSQQLQIDKLLQKKTNIEDAPDWVQQFVNENLYINPDQWDDFQNDFNNLSDNFLTKLKTKYAELTKADLQIISLILLGLSVTDITILLNLTKNTIWSRRQRIKKHLHLLETDDLDEWLSTQLNTMQ